MGLLRMVTRRFRPLPGILYSNLIADISTETTFQVSVPFRGSFIQIKIATNNTPNATRFPSPSGDPLFKYAQGCYDGSAFVSVPFRGSFIQMRTAEERRGADWVSVPFRGSFIQMLEESMELYRTCACFRPLPGILYSNMHIRCMTGQLRTVSVPFRGSFIQIIFSGGLTMKIRFPSPSGILYSNGSRVETSRGRVCFRPLPGILYSNFEMEKSLMMLLIVSVPFRRSFIQIM